MDNRQGLFKAELLIALRHGANVDAFRTEFHHVAQLGAEGQRENIGQTWALQIAPGEMPRVPHQILMHDSPPPFDAVIGFASAEESDRTAMTERLAAIARKLDCWLDDTRSAVFVGCEVAITLGVGPVIVVMPLRRLPGMSHEEFMQHWFGRHAALGEAVEGVRYRQNHVDREATGVLAAQIGLHFEPMDGITESYFPGIDEAVELLSRDEVSVGAIDDEKRFIHHPRSQFGFYRAIVQTVPSC